ncbi:zinc finger protein Gfi-1b-like [Cyprinodon tularosa]|uniref:zinc finger protein Gfi-1b-like n=1 Tax=Cyprinodon tularosa TaxID=77115 RepID=UPI0018E1E0CD|nr:zinc finger protein Gfi-1b-like [Cyprinodon tularosa]
MSPLLLRAFVNERLTAVVAEILEVFEGAIAKYEEEASSSKQEIDRLRSLLLEKQKKTDSPQPSTCGDKSPCEQESRLHQETGWNPELQHIKEEAHELWAVDQEEHKQAGIDSDALNHLHVSVEEEREQEDTKPPGQHWTQSSEPDGFQDVQELKATEVKTTFLSAPSFQDEAAAIFSTEQTQLGQSSFTFSKESTDSSRLNSPGADYQCSLCSESFPSSHLLMSHAFQTHSRDVGVLCTVCGGTFESAESLDVHLRSHEKSKCCPICGKLFKSTTSLREHMEAHAGLKLHRCHVCGKECRRKGDLRIHLRIHTGEKPFCCSLCCKSFTHSGHLKKHIRSHTGERPHRCGVCGRSFLQSAHLKSHLSTHAQKK